ncbi:hypothetical protein AOLI_G00264320 [Acnodon oligacanthus]
MSSLEENIKSIILKTLPSLPVVTQLQIVSMLRTSGVESVADLKYVQQEDIKGLLPVIHADSSDSSASTYPDSSLSSTSSLLTSAPTNPAPPSGLYRQDSLGCCGETGPQRGSVDTFGYTRFQPEPPKEETTDTLEEKRYRMENIYQQEGLNVGQRAEVINLMEATYSVPT